MTEVPNCPFWNGKHEHTQMPSGIFCEIVKQIVEEQGKPLDYKTLKQKWLKKKEETEK